MDSSCVEKYAESGFGRLQLEQFLQNPVLSDCSPNNSSKTRFWTIATQAIPPKPGFGRLQPKQFLQNPVLSDCSPNNSSKTRFWAIATQAIPPKPGFGQLQHSCILQLIRICGNPPRPFGRPGVERHWGERGGKKMKKTSIINQAIVHSRPLNSTSNGIGAT